MAAGKLQALMVMESQEQRDEIVREMTRAMVSGSERAFAEFYEMTFERLYRHMLAQTHGDEDLSKELIQALMLRVARYIQPFQNERMFWAWLWQIARSCHADWLRKKGRQPVSAPLEIIQEKLVAETPEADQEMFSALEKGMGELDNDERELLRLAYFEGVPHRDMAEKLSTTAKAVESRLGRIRQKLRRILLERLKDYALL